MKEYYFKELNIESKVPPNIINAVANEIISTNAHVKNMIEDGKLTCEEQKVLSFNHITLSKLETIETEIGSKFSTSPANKRRSVQDMITKKNQFIEEFEQKRIECEQFAKDMIKQAQQIKNHYAKIKSKKEQEIAQKEEENKKVKEKEDKSKILEIIQQKAIRHQLFQDEMQKRKEIREKYANAKAPKWENEYSVLQTEKSSSRNNLTIDSISTKYKEVCNFKAIESHQKVYLNLKKQKADIRKKKLESLFRKAKTNKALHTSFEKSASEEYKKAREVYNELKKEKTLKIEKMKAQALVFQELHRPTVDEGKKREIEEKLISVNERKLQIEKVIRKNIENADLKPWRKNISKHPKKEKEQTINLPLISKYPNYLVESRKSASGTDKLKTKEVRAVLNDPKLNAMEKYECLKPHMNWLEERAKMKEENINAASGLDDKSFQEATELYVNSIKAKLSLLGQFE